MTPESHTLVWYAAYGSNMHADRLSCYLSGGRPAGAARTYPGCRDPSPPRRTLPVILPGSMYFALESQTWTGGMAFYAPEPPRSSESAVSPEPPGRMPARAYLLTLQQFTAITAQEMRRPPADTPPPNLPRLLTEGSQTIGPGRYETLVSPVGLLHGHPLLTFTSPVLLAEAALNAPSAPYLTTIATGLAEAHPWDTPTIATYLSTRPGATGTWTAAAVTALLDAARALHQS